MAGATAQNGKHGGGRRFLSRRRAAAVAAAAVIAVAMAVAGCADDPQKPPVDPCAEHACDVAAVVTQLRDAYARRDYAHLARLLHDDYRFILNPDPYSYPPPPETWDKQEELRLHRRMFEPQNVPMDQPPVNPKLWLVSVNPVFTAQQVFQETHEYDRSQSNPEGLDPERWKVWAADYDAAALFETRGETDYYVDARAWFVVVRDLTKQPGDAAAFLLYRWQDLGPRLPAASAVAVEARGWASIKSLYR